ncbi:MAG TPA: DoxX family protein [Myxococcota bacterium]|nr:DoxX family protein [Myxococcota bacterium]
MSPLARLSLWAMGAFYLLAGLNHFRDPAFYLPMMPTYLPAHRELVELSGVAEFALGLALLVVGAAAPRLRRAAAWGVIALLLAIFPANLHVALHDVPIGGRSEGLGVWNWVRLPFQAVLIAWAWLYTRRPPAQGPSPRALRGAPAEPAAE